MRAVPVENASVVHTTPGLGRAAVGVQARIAGILDQEQCNHLMRISGEGEKSTKGEERSRKREMRELCIVLWIMDSGCNGKR